MANLSVRRIDGVTLDRLRVRAARHGVSMEEEIRRILRESVSGPEHLGDMALQMFGPEHGVDLTLPLGQPHKPPELGE